MAVSRQRTKICNVSFVSPKIGNHRQLIEGNHLSAFGISSVDYLRKLLYAMRIYCLPTNYRHHISCKATSGVVTLRTKYTQETISQPYDMRAFIGVWILILGVEFCTYIGHQRDLYRRRLSSSHFAYLYFYFRALQSLHICRNSNRIIFGHERLVMMGSADINVG